MLLVWGDVFVVMIGCRLRGGWLCSFGWVCGVGFRSWVEVVWSLDFCAVSCWFAYFLEMLLWFWFRWL